MSFLFSPYTLPLYILLPMYTFGIAILKMKGNYYYYSLPSLVLQILFHQSESLLHFSCILVKALQPEYVTHKTGIAHHRFLHWNNILVLLFRTCFSYTPTFICFVRYQH